MKCRLTVCLILIITQVHCFKQPNFVVILADDLGYNDVGYRGNNQVKTPNIDALAYNGVTLDNFYTLPICTPSRAALLTGNYPIRSGFQGFPLLPGEEEHIPYDMPTLPERLKSLGYKTHLVGKWHLGHAYRNVTPISRGFDSHYGFYNGFIGYFEHKMAQKGMNGFDFREDFEVNHKDDDVYATDLFTNRSVEIIDGHDYKNPLFLMISHLAVHTGKFVGPDFSVLEERDTEDMNRNFGHIKDVNRRKYADVLKSLDDSIGRVISALSQRGVLGDTFVLFMSDNGGASIGNHPNHASNWPLKGVKFSYYQGGIKGTAVFYSTHLNYKGKSNPNLMHITDLLPTFYAAGGGNTANLDRIDGVNQLFTLLHNDQSRRKEILINIDEVQKGSAIISHGGQFKLVQGIMYDGFFDDYSGISGRLPEDGPYDVEAVLKSETNNVLKQYILSQLTERDVLKIRSRTSTKNCRGPSNYNVTCHLCLFDLVSDPCETTNIAENNEDLVGKLRKRIDYFSRRLVPQQNKGVDERSNPDLFGGSWTYWLDENP